MQYIFIVNLGYSNCQNNETFRHLIFKKRKRKLFQTKGADMYELRITTFVKYKVPYNFFMHSIVLDNRTHDLPINRPEYRSLMV